MTLKEVQQIAKNMGLKIVGLLGVLLLNHRRGYLSETEVLKLLAQLKQMDFRLSTRLENDFIKQLQR